MATTRYDARLTHNNRQSLSFALSRAGPQLSTTVHSLLHPSTLHSSPSSVPPLSLLCLIECRPMRARLPSSAPSALVPCWITLALGLVGFLVAVSAPTTVAFPQSHSVLAVRNGTTAHGRGIALLTTVDAEAGSLTLPAPRSPRPTPAVPSGGLARVRTTYKSVQLPDGFLSKRQSGSSPPCLGSSTTVAQINALLQTGGASAGVLQFCPKAVISVDQTIYFSAAGQGLQTQGGTAVAPADRATFVVVSSSISTVAEATNCVK